VIRGQHFEAFVEHVVPLLDGRHRLEAVLDESSEFFDRDDLRGTIALLAEHTVLVDADALGLSEGEAPRLGPQLGYLQEISRDPRLVRERLAQARVTVVGLGAVGAVAATALAASNVGNVRCVDDSEVTDADPHLAQLFELADVGSLRAEVTGDKIRAVNPTVSVDVRTGPIRGDEDVDDAVDGSDFVLGCLDPGLAAVTDTLNSICLARRTPWSQATATGFEGVVGPTVIPHETACYRCYLSRTIGADDDPAAALRELEARYEDRADLSAHRENIPFAAGIVGHLLALQAFQFLAGILPRSAGRVLVVDFLTSTMREHVVLRKPWCTACFPAGDGP
jgi:ribosomal protein S12 methylthiotransferase accessory factor